MRILTIGAKSPINQALAERAEYDVWALVPHHAAIKSTELPYRQIPYNFGRKLSFSSILQVRDTWKRAQPDVVHAFYPRPLAHAVLAATTLSAQTPIVSYRGITSLPARWNPDEWVTYLSPKVSAHACESAAVSDALVAVGVPAQRCHVVHNCLGKLPATTSRLAARQRLGLSENAFVAMMVANMRPVKGADLLLEAALACRELPDFKVVLVGQVLDLRVEQLAKDARLANIVHLAGYRNDASELFAAADLFVMPSRAEALCVAMLEAMTQGVCPVVSDAGGMKEAVRNGVDGIVCPREDVNALADSLRQLHGDRDLVARYAASAQQRARTDFSAAAMVERLAAMYTGLTRAA
ncbi:MAG: glycosyltransferase family 4 protein [Aeoliella sp.]